jgi:hypothetical protein
VRRQKQKEMLGCQINYLKCKHLGRGGGRRFHFIYGLFNNAFSVTQTIVSNGRMIHE